MNNFDSEFPVPIRRMAVFQNATCVWNTNKYIS